MRTRIAAIIAALAIVYAAGLPPRSPFQWKNVEAGPKGTAVYGVWVDSRGLAWVGTARGAYFYDGMRPHAALPGPGVYAFAEKDGKIYIGTSNGLMVYDRADGSAAYPPVATPKEIRCLMLRGSKLFIGSLNGLYLWNMDKGGAPQDISRGLPSRSVYALLTDSKGTVYAGTLQGLARWDSHKKAFQSIEVPCGTPFVNCLAGAADGQSILVGGNKGLWRYWPKRGAWEREKAMGDENVKCLATAAHGRIFVGTENGIFDLHKGSVGHYSHNSRIGGSLAGNEIWSLMCDRQGNVWAGTDRGFSIAATSGSVRTWRLGDLLEQGEVGDVAAIAHDKFGRLWIGGMSGVLAMQDGRDAVWHTHDGRKGGLPHNHVRAIRTDSKGDLWLCTDGGLCRYDYASGNFETFHLKDESGNPVSDWIYDVVEDSGGQLYVCTYMDGLRRIDRRDFPTGGGAVRSVAAGERHSHVCGAAIDNHGSIWSIAFADNSLTRREPSGRTSRYDIMRYIGQSPIKICLDSRGRVWVGAQGGCAVFGRKGHLATVRFPQTNGNEEVLAMAPVGPDVWVSTQSNVWRIDGKTLVADILPIPPKAYTFIYDDSLSGRVLLGATDEIAEADPRGWARVTRTRSGCKLFTALHAGDGAFVEARPGQVPTKLAYGGGLTVVVGTSDYSPDTEQRYAYKLADDSDDTDSGWIFLPKGSNEIVLTEMAMGRHRLLVKPVGSPFPPMTLDVEVGRPWTLSGLAIAAYILIVLGLAFGAWRLVRRRAMRLQREADRKKALDDAEKKLVFLTDISHDLKTPLSMIMGPVSMMKEKAEDAHDRKTLEMVYQNAVKLWQLIHRTLELRQIEDQDESMLILSPVEVVQFCSDIFETFRAGNPHRTFVFHSSIGQATVEADVVKLESVITNLLSNACKYSSEGATVSCGIQASVARVEITVADDGAGIAPADRPLVFHRMYRAASAGKCEGTGIGLYLVKKYVELMKGTVEMHSEPDQGTSFTITLPLRSNLAAGAAVPAVDRKPTAATPTADSAKPKVLIVEDNSQIAGFIAEFLAPDYVCFQAGNGRAGLSLAFSMSPDIVVLDEMMPIMSGLQMAAQMKKDPRLALIPIIMLTAKDTGRTENESVRLGVDVFMGKPFEPSILAGRIKMLLQRSADISKNERIQRMTQAKPVQAESAEERLMAKIAKAVEDGAADADAGVAALRERTGISNKQLYRLIKKYLGVSPSEYIRNVRLQKAAMLLGQKRFTIAEVAYMVGFQTPSYFAKCFQDKYGVPPSQYEDELKK